VKQRRKTTHNLVFQGLLKDGVLPALDVGKKGCNEKKKGRLPRSPRLSKPGMPRVPKRAGCLGTNLKPQGSAGARVIRVSATNSQQRRNFCRGRGRGKGLE